MARDGWIRGPFFDGLFMLAGIWLAPAAILLGQMETHPDLGLLNEGYLVLTALFWIGHRVSSAYLAYCTTAYRPLLTTQRTRFLWVPLGIVVAVFAFLVPEGVWPWTRAERLMALVMTDFVLIAYHFASQHYGILSLYRVRASQPRTRAAKIADRTFALIVGGALIIVVDSMLGTESYQSVWLHGWAPPDVLDRTFPDYARLGTVVVVLGTALLLVRDRQSGAPSLPRTLYILSVSLVVLTAFWAHPFVFVVLWTVQHWMAAMGLAVVVARRDPDPGPSPWYRAFHFVNRRPMLTFALLAAVSVLLLPLMEVEAVPDPRDRYSQRIVPFIAETLASSAIAPPLVALGFVTAFLHYQLDRAVFRLSNSEVRTAVGRAFED